MIAQAGKAANLAGVHSHMLRPPQLNSFGEQAKSLSEACTKAAAGATKMNPFSMST
jgi:hypothetical protein